MARLDNPAGQAMRRLAATRRSGDCAGERHEASTFGNTRTNPTMPRKMPSHKPNQFQSPDSRQAIGSRHARGYDSVWTRYSKLYLRQHPLCRSCEQLGRTTVASLVDHIIPLRLRPDLRLDPENLQPLCRSCHAVKTAAETRNT
ncbi:HNH endonuclease [bacterium]|nr:HNH endonuclease [bacterium]